jgi:23S rRNA (pseudouridine1915-N3)-methyltransferase
LRLRLIAVGTRMPDWVQRGVAEYVERLPREFAFAVDEVKPVPRKAPSPAAIAEEGARVLARIPRDAHVVLLDERGSGWTTVQFAARLGDWQATHAEVALLVGGADGHADAVRALAKERWSLSPLTLPHALVRVVLAEQLYRAVSVLRGHPYHRA